MPFPLRSIGSAAALHIQEQYRCKGFGGLVIRAMAKLLAKMDSDMYCYVEKYYFICINLLKRNGFTHIGDQYFIITEGSNWIDSD